MSKKVKATLESKVVGVLEAQGWTLHSSVYEAHSSIFMCEISKPSPAGEDFLMCISAESTSPESFVQAVDDYGFCPDEHAKMWIEAMDRVSGVPQKVITIARDAIEIEKMINCLVVALLRSEIGEEVN